VLRAVAGTGSSVVKQGNIASYFVPVKDKQQRS
jgi:hypothetical protein